MWIKKDESSIQLEAEEDKSLKKRLLESLKFGSVFFLVFLIIGIISNPDRVYNVIDSSITFGLVITLVSFIMYSSKKTDSKSMLCDQCTNLKSFDRELTCKCGGQFFPINNYVWIEDDKSILYTDCSWVHKYKILKNEA